MGEWRVITTYKGVPELSIELPSMEKTTRLGIIGEYWKGMYAWDGLQRFVLRPQSSVEYSAWQKVMAHTCYNPQESFACDWHPEGECYLADIVSEIEKGLEDDDDCIQQWFDAKNVLKLLNSAQTFTEMVDRILIIHGGFESDDRLKKITHLVIGDEEYHSS